MERESSFGVIRAPMMEIFIKTTFTEMESMFGQMVESIVDNG